MKSAVRLSFGGISLVLYSTRVKKKVVEKIRFIVGVDEAGRGPLAGPVAVGIAVVPYDFDWNQIPNVGDSKKVSEKNREAIFKLTKKLQKEGVLRYHVSLIPSNTIDRINIRKAVLLGIERSLLKLKLNPEECDVRLDGLLHAPKIFKKQQTIIKGDAKEKVIGLASIMAKVTRDRYMVRIASQYPSYGFAIHKGYGTLKHRTALEKHGLSKIHRKTFCKKYL